MKIKSGREIIHTRRAEARRRIRFFKISDLDKIRISDEELKEKYGANHLKKKAEICLDLTKQGKEFITDCWITVYKGKDHWFADIFVTEDLMVIEIIPFQALKFVLKEGDRWRKQGLEYKTVMGDY